MNYFVEQQNMAYYPSQLQPQILWQPVVVQQLKDQTIEQLRRQNDFLKHQLTQVLKINNSTNNFQQHPSQLTYSTDTQSFFLQNQYSSSRNYHKNACFSPRTEQNSNRLSFNRSPNLRSYLSPNLFSQKTQPRQINTDQNKGFKRMVISKGKDGKYYRDIYKEFERFEMSESHKNPNTFLNAQNSALFSALTPAMRNKQNNEMFFSSIHNQITTNRLRSPSFLKKIHRESEKTDKHRTSLLANLKQQFQIVQNQPIFKRSHQVQQSIVESEQAQKDLVEQQNIVEKEPEVQKIAQKKAQRHQSRVPTLQLSYQCDSNLSIQMMMRQLKRQKKKKQTKFSNCDHFLKQIEQNLDAMYGGHQRK